MNAPPHAHDEPSFTPLPAAEPMTRTDSGFEEYQRPSKQPAASYPETAEPEAAERKNDHAFSTTTLTAALAVSSAPDQPQPCHDAPNELESRSPTTASGSERPPLKKRRSRPSSKHSSRSTGRSSLAYQRPSFSSRVRSFPEVPHHGDINEVLALHSRSCSLFQSFSVPSSAPQSPGLSAVQPRPSADFPIRPFRIDTTTSLPSSPHDLYPMPSPAVSTFSQLDEVPDDEASEHVSTPIPATVIHWNSPSTRRREYAEIDRSTKGLRGLVRRVTPRWLSSKPPRQPFYDEEKDDGDDACSVRRYRIELPADDDTMSTCEKEKAGERRRPSTAPSKISKLWSCY